MIELRLTSGPLATIARNNAPLATIARQTRILATIPMDSAPLTINLDSRPLAVIGVPAFPGDPRELKDAAGDFLMGADGEALWGAN